MSARLVERDFCGKLGHSHSTYLLSDVDSPIIIRGQLGDEEWEFLGHIYTGEVLLIDIRLAIGVRENDIDNVARTTQARRTNFHPSQRTIAPKSVGSCGVDSRIAHSQIVEGTVLVGGTRIICHVHNPIEQLLRSRFKLLCGYFLWSRNSLDERLTVKR